MSRSRLVVLRVPLLLLQIHVLLGSHGHARANRPGVWGDRRRRQAGVGRIGPVSRLRKVLAGIDVQQWVVASGGGG